MRKLKPSGIEWLGDVPEGWGILSIGALFEIRKDIIGHEPEQVLSITQKGIKIKNTGTNTGQMANSYANYQIVHIGDFAMNHMDLITGWIDISSYEGVTSPDYRVFTPKSSGHCAPYFLHVFQSYYTNRIFYGFGQGVANAGRWRLPAQNFRKISIPVPPREEQPRIATYLDAKCAQLDALVANEQAQIEKLKQYRKSLITEAVTKGLDPTAPTKPSGVEWLGDVPAHWRIAAIKWICSMRAGKNLISEQISPHGNYAVYGGNGIRGYYPHANVDFECLLIGRQGALCGNVHHVDRPVWATEHALITKVSEKHCIRYIYYLLCAMHLGQYANNTAAQPGLAAGEILQLRTLLPPILEQWAIAEYLDTKCAEIDALIAVKEAKIAKLGEYRKSLIYECVTGKREVETIPNAI